MYGRKIVDRPSCRKGVLVVSPGLSVEILTQLLHAKKTVLWVLGYPYSPPRLGVSDVAISWPSGSLSGSMITY
jgi:hypothetical protein